MSPKESSTPEQSPQLDNDSDPFRFRDVLIGLALGIVAWVIVICALYGVWRFGGGR